MLQTSIYNCLRDENKEEIYVRRISDKAIGKIVGFYGIVDNIRINSHFLVPFTDLNSKIELKNTSIINKIIYKGKIDEGILIFKCRFKKEVSDYTGREIEIIKFD